MTLAAPNVRFCGLDAKSRPAAFGQTISSSASPKGSHLRPLARLERTSTCHAVYNCFPPLADVQAETQPARCCEARASVVEAPPDLVELAPLRPLDLRPRERGDLLRVHAAG